MRQMMRIRSLARRRANRTSFALLRVGGLVHTFPSQHPICFWFILRCHCSLLRRVERPLLIPCSTTFNHLSHERTRSTFVLQDPISSYATSFPLLFFIVGVVLECSVACVVSLFGQSVPEVPYARSSPALPGTPPAPAANARRARSSCGLPVGPGPSCARTRSKAETQAVRCTSRQYVDMYRSFAALSTFRPFLVSVSRPPALWLHRKTRCGCRC
jgi:hypothetical protein